jgi:predicted aspartyl protease
MRIYLALIIFSLLSVNLFADTIYLKNGSRMEGVIEREDKNGVELNLGFGTTTFSRGEIDHIVRSNSQETEAIWQEWGADQKEIEKRKPEEEKKWRERQAELERLHLEEQKAKKDKDEFGPKDIQVITKNHSMLVNVLLNGKVRVTLVLDSGAAHVALRRQIAGKLGFDVEKLKKINIKVADGRTIQTASAMLDAVKIQNAPDADGDSDKKPGVEAKNVEASFLLEEIDTKGDYTDGLLGMSFLKNFKFNADYKNSKVTFERLKDA